MNPSAASLPEDVPSLKDLALSQGVEIKRLELMVRIQGDLIRLMRIEKYGPKSEKLSDAQLSFLDQEPSVRAEEVESEARKGDPKTKEKRKKRRNPKPGRVELPAHLPRVEKIIGCQPEQCRCQQCGGETKVIGYETSEVLDVKPAEYFVWFLKREKRACRCCPEQGVTCAPATPRIVEKGKLSDAFIIDVLIKKYRDYLPLFRQSASLLADADLEIDPSTLCVNVMKAGDLCASLARQMKRDLFAVGYIQADESPVGVLDPRTKGRNHKAYMWEYSRPYGPVIFDFQMSRSRAGPLKFLENYEGVLQTDGYVVYNAFKGEEIIHAACLTHARRYFDKARKLAPQDPWPLKIIGKFSEIYAIEKQARDNNLNASQRLALRQEHSVPLMDDLKAMLIEARIKALPASQTAKGCDYTLKLWDRLCRFLEDGRIEADNNWCENAIRPLALGRKNWMHIGSEQAGPKIAGIMSIMETCRRLDINVRAYLMDVLPGLAERKQSELAELTPMAWKSRLNTA